MDTEEGVVNAGESLGGCEINRSEIPGVSIGSPKQKEKGDKEKERGAATLEGNKEKDTVRVRVSHPSIATNIQQLKSSVAQVSSQGLSNGLGQGVGQKKNKQPAVKVTNKLEPRPIKLKSSRTGSKFLGGQQNKESKILKRAGSTWVSDELLGPLEAQFSGTAPSDSKIREEEATCGKPPDPVKIADFGKGVSSPNITRRNPLFEGNGGSAHERDEDSMAEGADDEMEEESETVPSTFPC